MLACKGVRTIVDLIIRASTLIGEIDECLRLWVDKNGLQL